MHLIERQLLLSSEAYTAYLILMLANVSNPGHSCMQASSEHAKIVRMFRVLRFYVVPVYHYSVLYLRFVKYVISFQLVLLSYYSNSGHYVFNHNLPSSFSAHDCS